VVNPVTFPSGRAKLATRPPAVGSATHVKMMGILLVALFAAWDAGVLTARIAAMLSWTGSAARAGSRSGRSSANRYSMTMFYFST